MSDLTVVALLQAQPGAEAAVHAALQGLVAPTLAEDGCLAYELFTSAADPTTFVTVERWRSQADLDAHMQTPHVAEGLSAAASLLAGPPAIHPLVPSAG